MTFNFSNGIIEALGIHLKSRYLIAITIYRQPDDQQRNHRSTFAEFKQLTQALSNYLIQQLQLVARLQRMYPRCYDEKLCAICLATVPDYVPPRNKAHSSNNKIPMAPFTNMV